MCSTVASVYTQCYDGGVESLSHTSLVGGQEHDV